MMSTKSKERRIRATVDRKLELSQYFNPIRNPKPEPSTISGFHNVTENEILHSSCDSDLSDNQHLPNQNYSRSISSSFSHCSNSLDRNIFKLKDDLKRIAVDTSICRSTMNKILSVLHEYFPWLPTNVRYLVDCENKKFILPFNELNVFIEFDTNLTKDQESVKQLKLLIMKEEGYDIKKFIRCNFKNIFTDELSRKFTFNGRQGNLGAKKFNFTKILRDCTLAKFPNATQTEFKLICTKYFYYLKDKRNIKK